MAARLPGFLRRSVRANDSEDDDEEDSVSSSASSLQEDSNNGEGQPPDQSTASSEATQQDRQEQQQESQPQSSSLSPASILESAQDSQPTLLAKDAAVLSRASMPPMSKLQIHQPAAPLNRQSSEPRVVHASQTGPEDFSEGSSVHNDVEDQLQDRQQQREEGSNSQSPPAKARPKSYRETQFDKVFAANVVVSMNDLKTLAWNGIPPPYRPQAWKIIFGYLSTNASRRQHTLQKKRAEYQDAIGQHYYIDDNSRTIQEQEVLRQVLVDVPRTAPAVKLFRDERIKRLLTRILYIWAMRHPASSYVQGINDLAMPLIITFLTEKSTSGGPTDSATANDGCNGDLGQHMVDYDEVLEGRIMESVSDERLQEVEADCYWCLTNLLAGIQDHYTSDQPGVQRMVLRLEELVNRIDSDLCAHLRDTGIEFMQFAFKWMNCLLLREFNLKCVIRLWDTYISEKDGFEGFHVYVCAAFLCQFSSQLQAMSFDELFGFMQAMPTGDWGDTEIEMLLSQAYVLSTLFGGSDAHLTKIVT